MRFSLFIFLFKVALILLAFKSFAQPWSSPYNMAPPISGTLYISGAFGEIRTDHFHSGVDFRTGGKIGAKVYSSENGFVSRIRISATGFGKAIYIDHPNGLTTTYAHLDRFTEDIERFIKELQYRDESFEVDVYFKPSEFIVKRGQLIGWSGNSGSSGGPHLHYEVRRSTNQNPLNPHFSNIPLVDSIPPSIKSVWIYPYESSSSVNSINNKRELMFQGNKNIFRVIDTVYAQGQTGIGVEVYDYINIGSTRCGIYGISMYVNDILYYQFQVDEFSFAETRYANSHIDYALRQQTGQRVHRLFLDPNNQFSGYKNLKNRGLIDVMPDSIYNILVEISDPKEITTKISLTIRGNKPVASYNTPVLTVMNGKQIEWSFYDENTIIEEEFTISVPKNAMYKNLIFNYSQSDSLPNSYSKVFHIHDILTPLHKAYTLKIKTTNVPEHLRAKALLGTFNTKGKVEAAGGEYADGFVTASLRNFGDFFILVDSIAPQLVPLNITNGKSIKSQSEIRFRVKDELSGIASIIGKIDGKWALFEYDPKNDHLFYKIDKERLTSESKHVLSINVTDKKGNTKQYECTFFW